MSATTSGMDLAMSLSLLTTRLLKQIDRRLNIHGISFSQDMMMHHLHAAPNNTMRRIDLADSIRLTASGVTRLLIPMEKIRLVRKERNPRDARVSLVRLTETDQLVYQDATVGFEQGADAFLQPLSATQKARFLELTQAVP